MSWWNVRSSWASQSHVQAAGEWLPAGDREQDGNGGWEMEPGRGPNAARDRAFAVGRDEPRSLAVVDRQVRDPAPDGRHDTAVRERTRRPCPEVGARRRLDHRSITVIPALQRRRAWMRLEAATMPTALRNTIEP